MSQSDERQDSISDPGLDAGESGDWAGEGGAIPSGPATDPEDGDAAAPETEDDAEQPGSRRGGA